MVESSIFINLFLSIALALSVHAQTAPPPTISSATSITSESAYSSSSSSQMAWWNKTWDVVVVGSGPAGIIAASKCAASSSNMSVLLMEAGGPSYASVGGAAHPDWLNGANISRVDCPGLYNSIFDNSQPSTQSLLCNGVINAFGGCCVGGGTAVNAGLYIAPPDSDWDSWGIASWSSANINQSAAALQAMCGRGESVTSTDGQLYLQSSYNAMSKWLAGSGYSEVDINGQQNSKSKVYGRSEFDYSGGQRGGPVTNYLQGFLANGDRTALAQFANVTRVIRSGGKASGVEVLHCNPSAPSSCQQVNVSVSDNLGQVILSAGSLSTPKILYFSGIGPSDILNRLGSAGQLTMPSADWLVNEQVGSGLYDNPNTFLVLQSPDVQSYGFGYNGNGVGVLPSDLSSYADHRSGPYASPGQTALFWDSVNSTDGRKVGMQGTVSSHGYGAYQCPSCFTLNVYGTSGLQSRGRVDLDDNWIPTPSNDVFYQPNTTDANDVATFVHGLLQSMNGTNLTCLNLPQNATQSQVLDYITTSSPYAVGQTNHWGGSTSMSESCNTGVVAPNAKVCGMENLYIVDGGIIPTLFTVNPQYGIMVAGEYASDSIIADRGDCCGCLGQTTALCPQSNSTKPAANATETSNPSAKSWASHTHRQSRVTVTLCVLAVSFACFLFH